MSTLCLTILYKENCFSWIRIICIKSTSIFWNVNSKNDFWMHQDPTPLISIKVSTKKATILIVEYFYHFLYEIFCTQSAPIVNTWRSFCGMALNSKPTTHRNLTFFLLNSDFLIAQIPSFTFLWLFKKNCQKIAIFDSHKKTNTYILQKI